MAHRQDGGPALAHTAQVGGLLREAFNGGELWVGRHASDQDILVFDPAEVDPYADRISFYSLGQHRLRTFPRAIVRQHIHELTDELSLARALKDYSRRAELEVVHEDTLATERAGRAEQRRQEVLDAHRRYVEAQGIAYAGTVENPGEGRRGRRTKCHACGIALDNFVGAACAACQGVLCSCGTCACGGPGPRR